MIPALLLAVCAVAFGALATALRSRFGSLRLSEVPVLFWCALAGRAYRRQLRIILTAREKAELGQGPDEPSAPVKAPEGARFAPGGVIMPAPYTGLAGGRSSFGRVTARGGGECRLCGDDVSSVQIRVPESPEPLRTYCAECGRQRHQFEQVVRWQQAQMRKAILMPKPDLGDTRGDLARDMRDLRDLDRITAARSVPWCQEHMCPAPECPEGETHVSGVEVIT